MERIKNSFNHWTKYDFTWLLIANLTVLALGLYCNDSIISIISSLAGVTSVIFISKQMTSNFIFGLINAITYSYIAFKSQIYGEYMLNLFYFIPMQIIGYYIWSKNKRIEGRKEVKYLTTKHKEEVVFIITMIIMTYAYILKLLGGKMPLTDAISTVLSVIAMLLMVHQYIEHWYLWIISNIVSIIIWAVSITRGTGELATLIMWIIYLLNSIFGLYNWKKYENSNSIKIKKEEKDAK